MNVKMPSNTVSFEFDLAIYRLTAIQKAAYKYAGLFDIQIHPINDKNIRVTLNPKDETDGVSLQSSGFPNEVLDQELRECVRQETEGVRNLLLAHAFSSLSLLDPVGDTAASENDPLNIKSDSAPNGFRLGQHST